MPQTPITTQEEFNTAKDGKGIFEKNAKTKMDTPPATFDPVKDTNIYFSDAGGDEGEGEGADAAAGGDEGEGADAAAGVNTLKDEDGEQSEGGVNSGGGDIDQFVDVLLVDAMKLKDGLTPDHIIAGAERMKNNAKTTANGGRRRSKRRQPKRSAKQSKKGGRSRKNRRKHSHRRKH